MLARRRLYVLAYRSIKGYFDDGCSQRAAAISYYVLFSIFPLVIFSVGILGLALNDGDVQEIVDSIMENIPLSQDEGRDDVTQALERVARDRSGAIGIIGLLTLAWSGSAMFGVVRSSLNEVFHVQSPRPIVLQKLVDLGLVLVFAPFFILSVVATSALRLARTASEELHFLGDLPEDLGFGWWVASTVLPIAISFIAFFFVYWLIPARRHRPRYVVPGALLAAVLFEVVKLGFTIYLENFASYDVVFGSLGAVVAFLFWVYLSSNILLIGAEVVSELPDVMAGRFDTPQPKSGPQRTTREKIVRFLRGLILRPAEPAPTQADDRVESEASRQAGPEEDPNLDRRRAG
jgi:membrane protein